VDNFGDNLILTAGKASIHAGFNKLLIRKAKKILIKIKRLEKPVGGT
jgi:hypothetical protein